MQSSIGPYILVFCLIAALIFIWWVFHVNRDNPPTPLESAVAKGWLLIRRTVCFAGALLFFVGAIMFAFGLIEGIGASRIFVRLGYALFLLVLSGLCVWAAVFGWGNSRGDWKGGAVIHNKNKKRYGWRW